MWRRRSETHRVENIKNHDHGCREGATFAFFFERCQLYRTVLVVQRHITYTKQTRWRREQMDQLREGARRGRRGMRARGEAIALTFLQFEGSPRAKIVFARASTLGSTTVSVPSSSRRQTLDSSER